MSEENVEADTSCCASCGIAEVDNIKLTECNDCDLVRYCSVACQRDHIPHHLRDCKVRAAELRDELLFKQPESSHLGDCPICCLPLSLDTKKSMMQACCNKVICNGCHHANDLRIDEGKLQHKCSFCREPTPSTEEDCEKYQRKRIEANDPVAMRQKGIRQKIRGNYSSAVEWYAKAARLGDADSHFRLAGLYNNGLGVEKDREKEIHHLEEAAIGGHPIARYSLGYIEGNNGNAERAKKHWNIAATQGNDLSIGMLMNIFKGGLVSKDELAAALRAHHAAVDATKSSQREAAEEYMRSSEVS
eukprot:scaffold33495_cov105-Skeletonema_dohrnii-CCMP3373.AAC.6